MKKSVLAFLLASAFGAASAQSMNLQMPGSGTGQASGTSAPAAQGTTGAEGAAKIGPAAPAPAAVTTQPAAASAGASRLGGPVADASGSAASAAPTYTGSLTGNGNALAPGLVNPFNGKPLSLEDTQRELEASKMHTQRLEEQLKQTNLMEELKTVPMRKAVEAAQATTALSKEQATQQDIAKAMKAAAEPPPKAPSAASTPVKAAVKKPAKASKPVASKDPEASAQSSAASAGAMPPARPSLVSVVAVGTKRSAVLDFNGATLVASDGDMTPFGPLKVLDESSVDLGGRSLRVHATTLARFVTSDQNAAAQGATAGNVMPAAIAPTSSANLPPALPLPPSSGSPSPGAGARATMPPLQLPPGVTLAPTPAR